MGYKKGVFKIISKSFGILCFRVPLKYLSHDCFHVASNYVLVSSVFLLCPCCDLLGQMQSRWDLIVICFFSLWYTRETNVMFVVLLSVKVHSSKPYECDKDIWTYACSLCMNFCCHPFLSSFLIYYKNWKSQELGIY